MYLKNIQDCLSQLIKVGGAGKIWQKRLHVAYMSSKANDDVSVPRMVSRKSKGKIEDLRWKKFLL